MYAEDSAPATATPSSNLNTQSISESQEQYRLEVAMRLSLLQLKNSLTPGEEMELNILLQQKWTTRLWYHGNAKKECLERAMEDLREKYHKERADKLIGDALHGLSSAETVDLDEVDRHALKYLESRVDELKTLSKQQEKALDYSRWNLDGKR